jgi:hypothetical protein
MLTTDLRCVSEEGKDGHSIVKLQREAEDGVVHEYKV